MCLILHGLGHITIKLMFEQIWPVLEDNELRFLECYDFVFRVHSPETLRHLYILSPQGAYAHVFDLLDDIDVKQCDWPVNVLAGAKNGSKTVEFDGTEKFEATRLKPQIKRTGWLYPQPSADPSHLKGVAAFVSTEMSMAKIEFKNNQELCRFSPEDAGSTTYWMRLAYKPKVIHRAAPIAFDPQGMSKPIFRIQPCQILSPDLVLSHLSDQLAFLEKKPSMKEGAIKAREEALTRRFYSEESSTRIEDHRITLITTPEFMVSNTMAEGACGTLGVQDVSNNALARKWFMGAKHYATNDALTLARSVFRYLREWGLHVADAKSKEAITAALAPDQHPNISHIVEGLCRLGLIFETGRKGYYSLNEERRDSPLANALAGYGELDSPAITKACRDVFYGSLPIPYRDPTENSRFAAKGGRIHFDLAY